MYRIIYDAHNPGLADIMSTLPGGKLVFNLTFNSSNMGRTGTNLCEVCEAPLTMNVNGSNLVLIQLELDVPTRHPIFATFVYDTVSKTGVGMKHGVPH